MNSTAVNTEQQLSKRRTVAQCLLYALTLYSIVLYGICLIPTVPPIVVYFSPLSFLHGFLLQWFPPIPFCIVVLLLPLLGCLLLPRFDSAGRYLIRAAHIFLLCANCIITPLHVINGMGIWSAEYMGTSALLAIANVVVSVASLVLLHIWKPKQWKYGK